MKVVYLMNSKISGHHLGSTKSIIGPSDHRLSLLNVACALNMLHADDYGFVKQSMKAGLAGGSGSINVIQQDMPQGRPGDVQTG